MENKVEILQIIPADGWSARYKEMDGVFVSPLACWTLYRDLDGETYIGGVTADDIESGQWTAADTSNFDGFTRYAGES